MDSCDALHGVSSRVICTPDEFERSALMHVLELGRLAPDGPLESRREGLNSLLFIFVESGRGFVEEDGMRIELGQGQCALIDCRLPYRHATGSKPWRVEWMHFDGPHSREMMHHIRERTGGSFAVRATSPDRYVKLFEDVREAVATGGFTRGLLVNDRLHALFTMLAEDTAAPEIDRRAKRLAKVREWIDSHCSEPCDLDSLATIAGLNKYTLVREYHAKYGRSPGKDIARARIAKAKQLLRFTDKTVEQIGTVCGIDDPNYFSRLFRKIEGVSPSAFRREWRE